MCASLGATTLVAFLDTGSTHNFIGEAVAHRTGLPIQSRPRLSARVANDEKIVCPSVIRDALVTIDRTTFHVNLFVMSLASFDLVLRTQWLATLGPMMWDIGVHTMKFQHHWCTICWSSMVASSGPGLSVTTTSPAPSLGLTPTSEPLLGALLGAFGDIFTEPKGLPPSAPTTTASPSS